MKGKKKKKTEVKRTSKGLVSSTNYSSIKKTKNKTKTKSVKNVKDTSKLTDFSNLRGERVHPIKSQTFKKNKVNAKKSKSRSVSVNTSVGSNGSITRSVVKKSTTPKKTVTRSRATGAKPVRTVRKKK